MKKYVMVSLIVLVVLLSGYIAVSLVMEEQNNSVLHKCHSATAENAEVGGNKSTEKEKAETTDENYYNLKVVGGGSIENLTSILPRAGEGGEFIEPEIKYPGPWVIKIE